jgi:hypothetical protein
MDKYFSEETKNVIAESKRIALSLGNDYISTIHFLLADCKLNDRYSIRNFAFKTEEDLQNFMNELKNGEPEKDLNTVPLTVEAEQTINQAFMLWNNNTYRDDKIYPYHLFLAAGGLKDTLFYTCFDPNDRLPNGLEEYYISIGQIKKENIHKSFWKKIFKK